VVKMLNGTQPALAPRHWHIPASGNRIGAHVTRIEPFVVLDHVGRGDVISHLAISDIGGPFQRSVSPPPMSVPMVTYIAFMYFVRFREVGIGAVQRKRSQIGWQS